MANEAHDTSEAAAPQNRIGNTLDEQTSSPEMEKLLQGNTTLLVWLVFLALGGGILALYYARINYLPDIEWSSSIVYLAAASFIGGGVGLLLALSVFLPGFIWSEFLVFDPVLARVFSHDGGEEPCVRAILDKMGVPFGIAVLISHFALTTGTFGYSVIAVALLIIVFFTMRWRFGRLKSRDSQVSCEREEWKRRTFKYSFWFTLSVLLSQISMLVIYRLSGTPVGRSFYILTVTCTTGVLVSNHVVAVRYHHRPRQAIAASLVAAALLLFAADRFSPLSEGIMGRYGFGERHKVTLLVTDEGIAIIEKLGLPRCDPLVPDKLCGVEILSKIGSEYFLLVSGRKVALPKATVKSYAAE